MNKLQNNLVDFLTACNCWHFHCIANVSLQVQNNKLILFMPQKECLLALIWSADLGISCLTPLTVPASSPNFFLASFRWAWFTQCQKTWLTALLNHHVGLHKSVSGQLSVRHFLLFNGIVILRRPASATPYHGRRPPDVSTPPPSEYIEFNQLKEILFKKSGVLCYNFEVCCSCVLIF